MPPKSLSIYLSIALGVSLFFFPAHAQETVWYENSNNIEIASIQTATQGTYNENVANPDTTGINSRLSVARFVKDSRNSTTAFIRYNLPSSETITSLNGLSFSFQGYTNLRNNNTDTIRFYLRNSSIGSSSVIFEESNFPSANTWRQYTFNFSNRPIPATVVAAGGYDQIMIAVGQNATAVTTYYIDRIKHISNSTVDPNISSKADWIASSWGTRLIVPGGVRLDNAASDSDWIAGAQQIVNNLPTSGHVITSFTHPAHGYFFCLRQNAYVDIANEIHPDFVPSLANEQIILDTINTLKTGGKKVILYVATDGPSGTGGTPDNATYKAAWEAYYNTTWAGDEYAAYKNLCKGFFERFAGLVDGYWLDHLSFFPGTNAERNDFIQMIREIDPDVAIATNINKSYFDVVVDTDDVTETVGHNGYEGSIDSRNYDVIKLVANDNHMDFTPGHPTPLGFGAPSNSWAYEEYTLQAMVQNPRDSLNGNRQVVKHFWVPMRQTWTGASQPLWFDQETAHRFVDTIVNGNAAITWSNTTLDGRINPEDLEILKYIDEKLQLNEAPKPYSRPEGAFYVGETLTGFDAWSRSLSGHNDHSRAGDLDGDGFSNFIEYAFGGNVSTHDTSLGSNEVILDDGSGNPQLSYTRRQNTNLTYEVQRSDTLAEDDWQTYTSTISAIDLDSETEKISLPIPSPSDLSPKLFMRVTVSEE